jgi:hypothetical protein
VSERARILRGPWPDPPPLEVRSDAQSSERANRMSLGFVVRQCAVELGHLPTAAELAEWANHQSDDRGEYRLFGRMISAAEAAVILRHLSREVSVRPERLRRS